MISSATCLPVVACQCRPGVRAWKSTGSASSAHRAAPSLAARACAKCSPAVTIVVLLPRSWLVAALTTPDDGVFHVIRTWGNCPIFTGWSFACGNVGAHDEAWQPGPTGPAHGADREQRGESADQLR